MSNWLFVTPQSQSGNIAVMPMMLKDGAGLQLTLTNGGKAANSGSKTKTLKTSRRRARYEFGFGPAYLKKNEITAPASTGTTFDLDNFEKINDPTTTAAVGLDIYLDDRNEINVYWAPFEARDRGTFTSPVSFAGQIFPANRPVRSAWVYYDLRAGWRYNLILSNPWNVKLGVGLAYQNIEVDLAMEDQTVAATVEDFVVLPYLHASVGYQIGPRWSAGLSLEGISLSDDTMFDGSIHLDYRISDRWDFSIGYKYCARDMETSELTNKVVYNVPYLSVSFSWLR